MAFVGKGGNEVFNRIAADPMILELSLTVMRPRSRRCSGIHRTCKLLKLCRFHPQKIGGTNLNRLSNESGRDNGIVFVASTVLDHFRCPKRMFSMSVYGARRQR
jgi:hypothetical protein